MYSTFCSLFGMCQGIKETLYKRIECEFPLKYRQLMDSIRLFTEHSSHSQMLFTSPQ